MDTLSVALQLGEPSFEWRLRGVIVRVIPRPVQPMLSVRADAPVRSYSQIWQLRLNRACHKCDLGTRQSLQ